MQDDSSELLTFGRIIYPCTWRGEFMRSHARTHAAGWMDGWMYVWRGRKAEEDGLKLEVGAG